MNREARSRVTDTALRALSSSSRCFFLLKPPCPTKIHGSHQLILSFHSEPMRCFALFEIRDWVKQLDKSALYSILKITRSWQNYKIQLAGCPIIIQEQTCIILHTIGKCLCFFFLEFNCWKLSYRYCL